MGNIPLAAVLWNGGISFGGVLAFILADLIVLPILDIYRRYYGMKMTVFILATFYISMSAAALVIEFVFQGLGLIPLHQATVIQASVGLDYTTVLNIVFLVLAGLLVWRFFTTGGPMMLRRMTSSDHRSQMGKAAHEVTHNEGRNFSATSSALPCITRPLFGESFFWHLANSISRGKNILLHILLAVASSPKTEVRTTKALSTISAAAVLATTFAIPAWAGPVGTGRTAAEAPREFRTESGQSRADCEAAGSLRRSCPGGQTR